MCRQLPGKWAVSDNGCRVEVDLEARDGQSVASVSDTGIGIGSSDLPHVFDRFWRADKARSREQGGAGLGLSIATWIVEMHGGGIAVRSELGKGFRFRDHSSGRGKMNDPAYAQSALFPRNSGNLQKGRLI